MEITLDEGYSFGLGAFETIAVKDGKLIFLDRHLRRLDRALHFLKIGTLDERGITEKQVIDYVKQQKLTDGACKLTVSKENVVFQQRQNPYSWMTFVEQGICCRISARFEEMRPHR